MEPILKLITTPLALAALALLILGGVLTGLARSQGKPKSERRHFTNWIFTTVILLSVLANIAYLLQILFFSEVLVLGNVRDEQSNPVKFAYVDIQGVGRSATADDGSFQASIPYSRQRSSYNLVASAPGFASEAVTLSGQRPEPATIILKKLKATLDSAIQFPKEIILTQDIGIPLIDTYVKFTNNINRPFNIDDMIMELTPPGGVSISLRPIYAKPLAAAMTIPPPHPFMSPVGSNIEMALIWGQDQGAARTAVNSIVPKMPFHPADFCTRVRNLPDVVTQPLREVFTSRFFWKPGDYMAKLSANVDGVRYEKSLAFTVSPDLSKSLQQISTELNNCTGVGIPIGFPDLNSLLLNAGSAVNFARVTTR